MAVTSATARGFPKRNPYFLQYREHSNVETMFETRDLRGFTAITVPGSPKFPAGLREIFLFIAIGVTEKPKCAAYAPPWFEF